jgi:23S rRNA G2069 N7-methylase RlmK/C1962 C5-methylase RlmI
LPKHEHEIIDDDSVAAEVPEGLDHPMVLSTENGILYETYPTADGQKTGVYSDQRQNRLMMASHCRDRRVLDLCCYTGGFSLNALIHGPAAHCTAVDSSPVAIAAATANAQRNNIDPERISFHQDDVTTFLQRSIHRKEYYDVVILDPPKLAPKVQVLERATRKYHALNRDAAGVISPTTGGLLLTCTCSAAMTQAEGGQYFLRMVSMAAQAAGRQVTLLSVHGAAPCHTQSPMAFPASNYLTAALFFVHPKGDDEVLQGRFL